MIHFRLQINNPFNKEWARLNDWFFHDYKISKNKNLEIQFGNTTNLVDIADIEFDTKWTGHDHAGASFSLTILWLYLIVKLYDRRHWDKINDGWVN